MASTKTTNNIIAVAILAIIALLGTTAYFWTQTKNLKKDVQKYDTEVSQLNETQDKLEADYQAAVNSLDQMKTDNTELNQMIDKQKADLKVQKDKISKMLATTKNYKAAKAEIENMKSQAQAYIQQINDLKNQNQILTDANTQLQTDKTSLNDQLTTTINEKNTVNKQKDSIITVKKELENENAKLFVKANKASALVLNDIESKPYKVKSNGKYSGENNPEKMQLLKVCGKMIKNEITDKGQETFYLRLIAPDGNTVYNESAGSGALTKASDNSKVNYTKKFVVNYNGQDDDICLVWNKDIPLVKGKYQVELYNKGYLSGKSEFKLK